MGYNGTPSGDINCSEGGCPRGQLTYGEYPAFADYSNCKGRHAERNAIDYADCLEGATLYITCEPCYECRELISGTRLKRVVWPGGEYTHVHGE